jgi:hypothetical protein
VNFPFGYERKSFFSFTKRIKNGQNGWLGVS